MSYSALFYEGIFEILVANRELLAASEKLKWPMPVDYASATSDDRKAFEVAFLDLLKLQEM